MFQILIGILQTSIANFTTQSSIAVSNPYRYSTNHMNNRFGRLLNLVSNPYRYSTNDNLSKTDPKS